MRTLLLLGALAPLVAAPETPRVAVEPGTKLTKTFTNELHLELEEVNVTVNGEDQGSPPEVPEVTIDDAGEIAFVDEYVSTGGGRATELVRTFETLSDESSQTGPGPDGEIVEDSRSGSSELEGESVRFTWDGDAEAYDAVFADEDSDASTDLLDDLDADGDYRFLLPEEDVEVGDSWELDADAFDRISSPGGDLKILDDEDDGDTEFSDQFEDNLSGEVVVTLESIEDGIATLTVECEVETTVENDEVPEGAPAGMEVLQVFTFTFAAEGELIWDMEAGHAVSMELAGDVELTIGTTQTQGDNEIEVEQSFAGTFAHAATFE